jgi:GAF domain-containing protein
MTRRLRESSPGLRVVAGVWTHEITVSELRERMRNVRPDEVSTSLQEAVREIEKFAAEGDGAAASMNRTSSPIGGAAAASLPPVSPDPQPAAESPPSLAEVPIDDVYDVTLRHFAQIFDVPLSLTTIVDADGPFWHRPASDTNSPFDSTDGRWRTFIADHCATDLDLLIVDDVSKDPRFAKHSFLMERGVRFYAYLSLRDRDGHSVGSLCVVDSKPRTIGGPHRADLHARCRALMQAVEARLAEGASEFRAVALT